MLHAMDALGRELVRMLGPERALATSAALVAYECDAFTVHRQCPRAVVLPENTAEVQAIVRLLNRQEIPFLPRGAGTGLSGGATPQGSTVIIDTARMKQVLSIQPDDQLAVVQPGVVNQELSKAVAHLGLHYAPDPSSQMVCTIGGNLAENSGGPHCFKYGMTTDHILAVRVVLPDGEVCDLGSATGPRPLGRLDLVGLFTGSEGTFGIATEVTVRLSPDQESVRTLLASFRSMAAACATVSETVASGLLPAAMEILDRATIAAVEASVYRAGYPTAAAAVLLIELDGAVAGMDEDAERVRAICRRHDAITVEEAATEADRVRLWKGRKGAFGAMGRLNPDLYVLDGVVPRTKLVESLSAITAIGAKHGVTLTNVFHAGDGNLHPNISYDGRDPEETARVMQAGTEILQTCIDAGGSITGEHGIGSEKLPHVKMMFSDADLDVMERARRIFNPKELCNPGKVLPQRSSCAEVARWPQMVARVVQEDGGSET
jgi:glycolate oxidase subunit GlcD